MYLYVSLSKVISVPEVVMLILHFTDFRKEEDKLKVVANRDIPKNEVIVFEPPYVTEYTVYATHCDVCRRYLKLQSFPYVKKELS